MSAITSLCSLALILPAALSQGLAEPIMQDLAEAGFKPVRVATTQLSKRDAEWLYAEECFQPNFAQLVKDATSGPVQLVEIRGEGWNTPQDLARKLGILADGSVKENSDYRRYARLAGAEAIRVSKGPATAIGELEWFAQVLTAA